MTFRRPQRQPMPRTADILVTAGILGMIAGVIVILAVLTWQPWRDTGGGGVQGGADTPVPVHERIIPASR